MDKGLRMQARRDLLGQVAPDYCSASGTDKQQLLQDFVRNTGYARKYAQWLLNHAQEVFQMPTVLRQRYGPEVEAALVLVWKALNRICSKRLIPFLPGILTVPRLALDRNLRALSPRVLHLACPPGDAPLFPNEQRCRTVSEAA